jgi:Flp pilus assembly protein TadD
MNPKPSTPLVAALLMAVACDAPSNLSREAGPDRSAVTPEHDPVGEAAFAHADDVHPVPTDALAPPEAIAEPPAESEPAPVEDPGVVLALDPVPEDVDFEHRARERLTQGDLQGALTALRRHLSIAPRTTALLLRIGRLARQVDALDVAQAALEEAAVQEPSAADVQVERARVFMKLDDPARAFAAARTAVDLAPEEPDAHNLLGRAAMARSEWDQAEIALRRAVELDPTDPMLLNNLGLLYVYRQDGAAAVSALRASVELFGDRAPRFVFNNLGLAYELRGDVELAHAAFEDALIVDPGYVNAQINRQRTAKALERALIPAPVASSSRSSQPESPPNPDETDRSRPRPVTPSGALRSRALGGSPSPTSTR